MTNEDYKDLELIHVKLPRKDYETLLKLLERETAYNWFIAAIKSYWVWAVAGSILTVFSLYNEIIGMFK